MVKSPYKTKHNQKYSCNKSNESENRQTSKTFYFKSVHVFKLKKAEQRSPTLEDKLGTKQIYE